MQFLLRPMTFQAEGRGFDSGRVTRIGLAAWRRRNHLRKRVMSKYLTLIAAAGVLLAVAPAAAQQAEYPNRPIKIIVCLPPGGGVDTVTRLVADRLQRRLGQPIIIENKGGQSGHLWAEAVFGAEPDGYTLLASQPAPITTNPLLYKTISFDPARFTPVAVMTAIPNTLTVRSNFPAKTAQEFIAYEKANPGKIT